jgi:cytochrome c556
VTGVRAVASVNQLHEVMISRASDAVFDASALEAATDSITVACEACHRPYRDQGRQMGAPAK